MRDSSKRDGALRVIFAVEDEEERAAFGALMEEASPGCELFFPSNIANVEAIYLNDFADVIVTDFGFHGGALTDWLAIWPLPAVLILDPGYDLGRVEKSARDEAALFIQRMPGGAHIRMLPLLIRKVLNIRESVVRGNAHLTMSEHQYLNLLQAIPDIVYSLDGKGRFIYLNDAIRNLGYEPTSLIGKHFSEIVHPEDVSKVSRSDALAPLKGICTGDAGAPKLFDERRSGRRMTRNLELRLRRGELAGDYLLGSIISFGEVSCSGLTLPEFEGMDLGTVGIIRDITLRLKHQRDLEAALASKEILLKEIHHRVKNNLQVVSSLLNIQETAISDENSRKAFLECQTQIQTMAMVHEVLYMSPNLEGVEMQFYLERLVDYLLSIYESDLWDITCGVESSGVALNLDDAIPIALVVNELVSNCMKHAFTERRRGRIKVSIREEGGAWLLEVEDDGVGFGLGDGKGTEAEPGIGIKLVHALVAQIGGEVSLSTGRGGSGALVSILFEKSKVIN
jgi:PAS domain S-box-containing protein